jgi:hypothetical protein
LRRGSAVSLQFRRSPIDLSGPPRLENYADRLLLQSRSCRWHRPNECRPLLRPRCCRPLRRRYPDPGSNYCLPKCESGQLTKLASKRQASRDAIACQLPFGALSYRPHDFEKCASAIAKLAPPAIASIGVTRPYSGRDAVGQVHTGHGHGSFLSTSRWKQSATDQIIQSA